MTMKYLEDGTKYVKATHHNGKELKGEWHVTYKIDGVRAFRSPSLGVCSRSSEPLYNLDHLSFSDAEIFRENWNTSVSLVRTQSAKAISQEDVYELTAERFDERLDAGYTIINPTYETCLEEMAKALQKGYEGIVLRKLTNGPENWVKVVPEITADIRVTGFEMSDKRIGWIKNFKTAHGNIGATGFPEEELKIIAENTPDYYIGKIMEVGYREKTINGKLRFAKFKRWRFDKDDESV